MDIYLDASLLGIYPPLFASPLKDSCILFVVLDEMQYMYLEIEVEVQISGCNLTSRTTVADSHPTTTTFFQLTQATEVLDIDENRVQNHQKMARCNYIYCSTFQVCQLKYFNTFL